MGMHHLSGAFCNKHTNINTRSMSDQHQVPPSQRRDVTALLIGVIAIVFVVVFFVMKPILKDFSFSNDKETRSDSQENTPHNNENLPFVSVSEIWDYLGQGKEVLFLDIRSKDQFEQAHVAQAHSVSPDSLDSFLTQVTYPIIFIVFSVEETDVLQKVHSTLVQLSLPHFFIAGGFETLKREHYPLITTGDESSFIDQSKVTLISATEAMQYYQEHAQETTILDIRNEYSFAQSHVEGAINIPLELIESRSSSLSRFQNILIYGTDATESFKAAVRLADLNFHLVHTIDTPFVDFEKSGWRLTITK